LSIIQNKKMKDINKDKLKVHLLEAAKEADFNLYQFAEKYC